MEKTYNILLITDVNYWKQEIGSHQRVFALIEYLKHNYKLTIAYTKEKIEEDDKYIELLDHNIIFIENLEESTYNLEEVNSFLSDNPVIEQFHNKKTVSKTQTLLNKNNFSHVIVEYIKLSYLLPLLKNYITILDTHDIMNKRNESFKKNNQKHWIDISEEQELKILACYDKVICIQKVEHKYLLEKNIKSICCPHPVKTENLLLKSPKNKNIIFIAGFSIANNTSIKWFIDNVWIFFADIENLYLNIYGEVSKALKPYEEKYTNILLHGKIDNLTKAYESATIAINPVQMGGGLKIKNIEALAYGIPLITTNEGSKGLEKQINSSFLLANTKDEWIEKILSLTISENFRENLSKNSINYISKYFNSEICFKDLISYIEKNKKI
ncbi:glycosyltransferase [Halarcobacter sp.]|uniref:glycosyltransferase n=1 Tax=Halarcobacter sp. TaxID=2321133 RepID=UPI0029F5B646|nr:glycosyltransferase [Halarcobacter sp.]